MNKYSIEKRKLFKDVNNYQNKISELFSKYHMSPRNL